VDAGVAVGVEVVPSAKVCQTPDVGRRSFETAHLSSGGSRLRLEHCSL
jgi:hypothetical protein